MPENALHLNYEFNTEGNRYSFYYWLYNCVVLHTYVHAKVKGCNINNYFHSIINDLSLAFDSRGFGEFYSNNYEIDSNILKFNKHDGNCNNGLTIMENIINNGSCVMVQACGFFINFSKAYKPSVTIEEIKNHVPGHVFSILNCDKDYYYYYDEDEHLNKKSFVPYKENKEIGVIRKDLLNDALRHSLFFYTVDFNINNQTELDRNALSVIRRYVSNYYNGLISSKNEHIDLGRNAILKLIQFHEYDTDCQNSAINAWQLRNMSSKRELISNWIIGLDIDKYGLSKKLTNDILEICNNCSKVWSTLKNAVLKNTIIGEKPIGDIQKQYLLKLLQNEDILCEMLGEFQNQFVL